MTKEKNARAGVSFYPTANLAGLVFVLIAIWYAASSQNSGVAYLLLFSLAAVFLVSIPHTFLNLGGLNATTESAQPAFAGQEVSVPVEIMNESRTSRRGVALSLPGPEKIREVIDHIPAGQAARVALRFAAPSRGEHEISTLSLDSIYPLGFIGAIKHVKAPQRYFVYPKPAGSPTLPTGGARSRSGQPRNEIGEGDDFVGVRPYIVGESQRHIDWKAVARGQEMMTKQFAVETDGLFVLDFEAVPLADTEARLSQLALWIIEAERAQIPYGLRLRLEEIPPALGDSHFHRCLRALALFK